ncbi:MAG: DinB family protein [Promethearchaeota archaeon]
MNNNPEMTHDLLKKAIERHVDETRPLLKQLDDQILHSRPMDEARPLGEVILHMLRSLEFYVRGIASNQWEPLRYSLSDCGTAEAVKELAEDVFAKVVDYSNQISAEDLHRVNDSFNRPATMAEILLEMIEHSIHHRGQVTVYYRLLNIEPVRIPYIV